MSKDRLTKKEMQTDELQEALVDATEYVASHKSQTVRVAVAVGALALVVAAIWGGISWRNGRLGARLSAALAIQDAPLVTDGAAPAPGQKVYKDAAERTAELKKALKALADDAPSSNAGRSAALLLLSLEGGKGASLEPVKALAGSSGFEAAVAALASLEAQAANGQVKEAIAQGKKYLDGGSALPKDYLLYTLGTLSEKAGQSAEAKTFYNRVISDFPESPLRGDAQQKLGQL